jgi:hypothetical protein
LPIDPLDKGKGIETANASSESPISIWTRVFPGLDPTTVFFPSKNKPWAWVCSTWWWSTYTGWNLSAYWL